MTLFPPLRATSTACALVCVAQLVAAAAAQQQFAESVKTYAPLVRDHSQAVAAADFDRDGDVDLLIGNNVIVAGAQDRLLLNNGDGTSVSLGSGVR